MSLEQARAVRGTLTGESRVARKKRWLRISCTAACDRAPGMWGWDVPVPHCWVSESRTVFSLAGVMGWDNTMETCLSELLYIYCKKRC